MHFEISLVELNTMLNVECIRQKLLVAIQMRELTGSDYGGKEHRELLVNADLNEFNLLFEFSESY